MAGRRKRPYPSARPNESLWPSRAEPRALPNAYKCDLPIWCRSAAVGYAPLTIEAAAVLQRQIDEVTSREHAERQQAGIGLELGMASADGNAASAFKPFHSSGANAFHVDRECLGMIGFFDRSEVRSYGRRTRRQFREMKVRIAKPPISALNGPFIGQLSAKPETRCVTPVVGSVVFAK